MAIKKGASDIHIEPQEKGVVLRLRIDGVLYVENVLSKKIQLPLASRFKILSRLDISERRMPQDGRISIKIEDRAIDFRVSTVPAKFGEKIVMRILDKSGVAAAAGQDHRSWADGREAAVDDQSALRDHLCHRSHGFG